MLGKSFKIIASLLLVIALLLTFVYINRGDVVRFALDLPAFETEVGSVSTVQVRMSDGVRLDTEVYLPAGEGPWPVILIRDPYNRSTCSLKVRYGYACVHQGVRGRHDSEGDWYPVISERSDGLETLDWLLKQTWQDGNIATLGPSYLGVVQWSMIDQMPEEVKTVVADISHGDWYEIIHRNGHFVQGVMTEWAKSLHLPDASFEEMAAHRPAIENNDVFLRGDAQWYEDYLANTDKVGEYWSSEAYSLTRNAHKNASMPVLMMGAWHDFFLNGQFKVFDELPQRTRSLLMIRNGNHVWQNSVLEFINTYGYSFKMTLDWLDVHLKGEVVEQLPESGYVLQDNVDNSWNHFPSWPQKAGTLDLYLGNLGGAAICDGGMLRSSRPVDSGTTSYLYNPEKPVQTIGGSYNLYSGGAVEQGDDNCSRDDVMSFESGVLNEPLTLSGSIKVLINVSSDAPDSAFTVKVQEKLSDGRVINIRDDITSLSYRNGSIHKQPYVAGSVVELEFNLTPIEWKFQPGSSLRLDISSSNYPMFNAHPNVEGNWSTVVNPAVAQQEILGGMLSLPVR